mmetsp:Transcript_18578/g.56734  ORF Transcript_18578/g.56734 Transcript_18578/m.56734 type:complete len:209 (-) Transcript_18578:2159-2785(-)
MRLATMPRCTAWIWLAAHCSPRAQSCTRCSMVSRSARLRRFSPSLSRMRRRGVATGAHLAICALLTGSPAARTTTRRAKRRNPRTWYCFASRTWSSSVMDLIGAAKPPSPSGPPPKAVPGRSRRLINSVRVGMFSRDDWKLSPPPFFLLRSPRGTNLRRFFFSWSAASFSAAMISSMYSSSKYSMEPSPSSMYSAAASSVALRIFSPP